MKNRKRNGYRDQIATLSLVRPRQLELHIRMFVPLMSNQTEDATVRQEVETVRMLPGTSILRWIGPSNSAPDYLANLRPLSTAPVNADASNTATGSSERAIHRSVNHGSALRSLAGPLATLPAFFVIADAELW